MQNKYFLHLINFILISILLVACGAPGTEKSSPVEIESTTPTSGVSSEEITEDSSEAIPTDVPKVTDTPEPSPTPSMPQEDLIEEWQPLIGSYFLVGASCQVAEEMLLEFSDSGGDSADQLGASFAIGLFLNGFREAILEWEPSTEMQIYQDEALNHLDSILDTVGNWFNDEITTEDANEEITQICQTIETELEEIGESARQAGLTEESLVSIGEQIEEGFTEFQDGLDAGLEDEPAPISTEVGMSRANPFPPGEMHTTPNWDIQVIESIRGEEAWQMIQAANSFNDPPNEGQEYILIKVKTISTHEDNEEHNISSWDFNLTGSNLIEYDNAEVVEPEPALDATLYSGGETEGWLAFAVGSGEENLILILDESANWEDDRFRFFAVEDGVSITIDTNLSLIQPTELGIERTDPAPLGETVITEDWEVVVNEVVRGDEAWQLVQSANQYNDPPEDGMEYVAVKVWVRNIGTSDTAIDMDSSSFKSTGGNNTLYDSPYMVDPEPTLGVNLFSGGVYEGWITLVAAEGETGMMAVFQPWSDWDDTNKRFLSLEP